MKSDANQRGDAQLYDDPGSSVSIDRCSMDSTEFQTILDLRWAGSTSDSPLRDSFDLQADLYVMRHGGKPIATMRINQARRSKIDCEEAYPEGFLSSYRSIICSASRFLRHPEFPSNVSLMQLFMREIWRDQFADGMRVDIINVHQPMIPYYSRMGYVLLCHTHFKHPRLGTPSQVMCCFADPRARSPFREVFAGAFDPVLMDLLKAEVPLCWNASCLRKAPGGDRGCATVDQQIAV